MHQISKAKTDKWKYTDSKKKKLIDQSQNFICNQCFGKQNLTLSLMQKTNTLYNSLQQFRKTVQQIFYKSCQQIKKYPLHL